MENVEKGLVRQCWRHLFSLMVLNLLTLAGCLPILTIPAALTALSRSCQDLLLEKPRPIRGFCRTFRTHLLPALPLGLLFPLTPAAAPVRLPFLCAERRNAPLAADSRPFLPAGGLPGGLCIRSGLPHAGPDRPVRPDGPSQQLPAAVPGLCLRCIAAFGPAGGRDGPSLSTFPPGAGAAGGLPSRFHRRLRHPAHAGRSGGEKGDRIKMSRSGEHSGTFFSLSHSKNGA